MTAAEHAADDPYEPPGPGPWVIDRTHVPRPVTRYSPRWCRRRSRWVPLVAPPLRRALLGAVVTDNGSPLSHAAIVAREFGIPAVVGTQDGPRLIPDGARVRVDGVAGEVTLM